MDQQVSPIVEGWSAKVGLRHDERWLKGELVPEKDVKVKLLNRLLNAQCRCLNLKIDDAA
jgi:hypothetical protein